MDYHEGDFVNVLVKFLAAEFVNDALFKVHAEVLDSLSSFPRTEVLEEVSTLHFDVALRTITLILISEQPKE